GENCQAAEDLDERGRPGRGLRQRRTDLFQQLGEPCRPPTELGPPVSQEAKSDHQAERQRRPLSQKPFIWQFEHFDLPTVRAPGFPESPPPLAAGATSDGVTCGSNSFTEIVHSCPKMTSQAHQSLPTA